MAALKSTRSAQNVLEAEFSFTIGDTMVNTAGAADAFASVAAHVFDIINLPPGACVVGGEVVTDTAFTGSTAYNVTVGDSASAARYLGTTDKTTAARTALVPTGYLGLGENLRLTVTPTLGAATAGKITVRVLFTVTGRANEVVNA
jgi:hypothetical protein